MNRPALLLCAVLACGAGCGTTDDASPAGAAGGDPNADADSDFLTTAQEAEHGTDPSNPDTDGDSYLDGDEVLEATDPLDANSRIYQGGWPYQRSKDEIVDPGFMGTPVVGAVMPRLIAYDQFGQQVDLYDFARHGRRVVIDLSAIWCEACKDLAHWLGREPSANFDARPELAPIVDMVEQGQIYWITVVFEDGVGNAAGPAEAVAWAETFPHAKIAVLADNNRALFDFLFPGGYPNLQVLDEDMTLRVYDRFDYNKALTYLLQ
jgi:thiol-disulfide isomerase/thioredoxin